MKKRVLKLSGLNKYDDKLKRQERRRNHVAFDLATVKYRQRTIPNKRKRDEQEDEDEPDEFTTDLE
jgi:hypothetical protein